MAVLLTSVSCFWPAPGPSLKACQQPLCQPAGADSTRTDRYYPHTQLSLWPTIPMLQPRLAPPGKRVSIYALEMMLMHMQCAVTTRKMAFKPLSLLCSISCSYTMDIYYVCLSTQWDIWFWHLSDVRDSSRKNENTVIIYSPTCCSKPVWLCFQWKKKGAFFHAVTMNREYSFPA